MPMVLAKCTECGGTIKVDSEKKLGICENCGQPFVVEDAIQTFNTYYQTTNNYNTTHNYGDGAVVNVYEDANKDFVIEAGVLKEYHGASVDVVLPDNIKSIDKDCFIEKDDDILRRGKPIETINIGTNVIDKYSLYNALSCCRDLKSVEVGFDNKYYTCEDGVLYNKDKTDIIFIPPAYPRDNFTFTVKLSVQKIYDNNVKTALHRFAHLNYGDVDFMHLDCQDFQSIELAQKMNLPYKITKHNFVDKKCTLCYEYDLSGYKSIHFGFYDYFGGGDHYGEAKICFLSNEKAILTLDEGNLIQFFKPNEIGKSLKEDLSAIKILVLLHLNDPKSNFNFGTDNSSLAYNVREGYHKLFSLFPNVEELIVEEDTEYYNYKEAKYYSVLKELLDDLLFVKLTFGEKFSKESANLQERYQQKMEFRKISLQQETWRKMHKCQYCGGEFKYPLFGTARCKNCGKAKNY